MIESIQFINFKSLREGLLPLQRMTLIVGPNGSGKTSALLALQHIRFRGGPQLRHVISASQREPRTNTVEIRIRWTGRFKAAITTARWGTGGGIQVNHVGEGGAAINLDLLNEFISGIRYFAFDATAISEPVTLQPDIELGPKGENAAGVLDRLRDQAPERFEAMNEVLAAWLPEYDRVLFDTPQPGMRSFSLRTKAGGHAIPASELSHGTLLAVAMLTLAYLPTPPTIVCLEEPDHGIHPRLLRDVKDALSRLAYPEDLGEKRAPVQVIATTHSPYLLDLFRDEPENVVISQKVGLDSSFTRLSDRPDIDEILRDARLGEVWYSGILGGVPASP
jgi:predicted ATPase